MGINRQFIRAEIQVANKHEKCSTSLVKIKIIAEYFPLIKMANFF